MYFPDGADGALAEAARPAAAPTRRYFREADAGLGIDGTVVPAWLLNQIVGELLAVVQAAGLAPSKTDDTQLLAAVQALAKPRCRVRNTAGSFVAVAGAHLGDLIRFTDAPATLSLPAAAAAGDGWLCWVQHAAASEWVTIQPDGTELIDGRATLPIGPGEHALVLCDGIQWRALIRPTGTTLGDRTISAGTASVAWSIPADRAAGIQELRLVIDRLQMTSSDWLLLQVGSGSDADPSWVTAGYDGMTNYTFTTGGSGDDVAQISHTAGFVVGSASATSWCRSSDLRLTRMSGDRWHCGGGAVSPSANGYEIGGSVVLAGLTRIRLIAAAGGNTLSAGQVLVRAT